ncbi:MAG TPA: hypothetical protein VFG10_04010 [Saprospiraceae bacterium]|nr:hypothetical protein [Saprospiraceae bacterium]
MKIFKRIVIALIVLAIIGIIFRGWIYRRLVNYESIGQRRNYAAIDSTLINLLNANEGNIEPDINKIIHTSLSLTAQQLNFTTGNNDEDPNKLIYSRNANCVGYAAFFSVTCNQLLKKTNLFEEWSAHPQIGLLYCLGNNVHTYFKSAFFKDHDFVIVKNKKTGQTLAVDPSVNDCTGIEYVTLRRKHSQ